MDNGRYKIHTTNQRPSEQQLATFKKYAANGFSNELIAILTGWRKKTVDKYVQENEYVASVWNDIKEQMADMTKKKNGEIDEKITILHKQIEELETKKKMYAACSQNIALLFGNVTGCEKFNKAKIALVNLFSDGKIHTKKEVENVLRDVGYSINVNTAVRVLRKVFSTKLAVRCGKYYVQAA